MIFFFIYDLLLLLGFAISVPYLCYQRFVHKKYQSSFLQRCGSNFPFIQSNNRFVIWIHAVSMGETRAIAPLIRMIKKQHQNPFIIVSSITETGHHEAKKSLSCADHHIYLPFDFSWIISPIVKLIKPKLVLISETDFWLNFLAACKKNGAKVVVVNGKLSEKSAANYQKLSFFSKKLFKLFDLICVQSNEYQSRFIKAGAPLEKVFITGNLKLDDSCPLLKNEELHLLKGKLGIQENDQIIVLGSSHSREEEAILKRLDSLLRSKPELKIIIVPRHPERFEEVAQLLESLHLPTMRLSKLNHKKGNERIILIDSMGLLNKCYQIADIAIVCGSFYENVGGHNIIEPCKFGIPTLFGPYMHNQKELVSMVKEYEAGLQLETHKLDFVVEELLENLDKRQQMGDNGIKLIQKCGGATSKTCQMIQTHLNLPI